MKTIIRVLICMGVAHLRLVAEPSSPGTLWSILAPDDLKRMASVESTETKRLATIASLNDTVLNEALAGAPQESSQATRRQQVTLPSPSGGMEGFTIVESSIMSPQLSVLFPSIRTFRGESLKSPQTTLRLEVGRFGLHAQVISINGSYVVDPIGADNLYSSSWRVAFSKRGRCGVVPNGARNWKATARRPVAQAEMRWGGAVRTYRAAVGCTPEYYILAGGTVEHAMEAIVSTISRVTGVYEREMGIRLQLVAGTEKLIMTNDSRHLTDNNPIQLIEQSQALIDEIVGTNNYDIGHFFGTRGGGYAAVGCVCLDKHKGRGASCFNVIADDSFAVDLVAHEMGHQFGANHTFNSTCGGANYRNSDTAYEPGSGSTIMAYAGVCSGDDIQSHNGDYFHVATLQEITDYITLSGIPQPTPVPNGNSIPTVRTQTNDYIPRATPFKLVAAGDDPDGDALTFAWEQYDLGVARGFCDPGNDGPIFRSLGLSSSPGRAFTDDDCQPLPVIGRQLTFRVTARDSRSIGGAFSTATSRIHVVGSAGPFRLQDFTHGNPVSNAVEIAWDVAHTDEGPISCNAVDILLSTDGGSTFPFVLAAATENDGHELVPLPEIATKKAIVRIEAKGRSFFSTSSPFAIHSALNQPTTISLTSSAQEIRRIANAKSIETIWVPEAGSKKLNDLPTNVAARIYSQAVQTPTRLTNASILILEELGHKR